MSNRLSTRFVMRSQNLARAVLRSAVRSSIASGALPRSAALSLRPNAVLSSTSSSSVSLRTFTSSSIALKKKSKKNAFSAAEDDLLDDDDVALDDDDLFGSVSDSPSSSSTSPTSSPSPGMSRVEFAKSLESYSRSLEWDLLDRGQFPSLSRWRLLASNARTQPELEQVLELAKTYRDRVGSLGTESGLRFAARASAVGLPEVALNAFLDRYTFGLEYDNEALWLVMRGLGKKLTRRRETVIKSGELPGAPVQTEDVLGVIGAEGGEGKAEAIPEEHELDMPLARAKFSIIDRMCLVASLSPPPHDPLLLSYLPASLITAFNLTSPTASANPLLEKVFKRTDELVSLLTASAQTALIQADGGKELGLGRSHKLGANLGTTLAYVAQRSKGGRGEWGGRDPVRTLYRYMDKVGPQEKSALLVRKVEPLLQTYA